MHHLNIFQCWTSFARFLNIYIALPSLPLVHHSPTCILPYQIKNNCYWLLTDFHQIPLCGRNGLRRHAERILYHLNLPYYVQNISAMKILIEPGWDVFDCENLLFLLSSRHFLLTCRQRSRLANCPKIDRAQHLHQHLLMRSLWASTMPSRLHPYMRTEHHCLQLWICQLQFCHVLCRRVASMKLTLHERSI